MQPHANAVTASGGGSGKAKVIRRAVPRETKVKSGRPLQRVFIDPTGPYPSSRAPFVGEEPMWGGGEVWMRQRWHRHRQRHLRRQR